MQSAQVPRTLLVAAALAALALPLSSVAAEGKDSAACSIGEIHRVFGEVKIVRDGNSQAPIAGESFCPHDRFITGDRGIAVLQFNDNTTITVGKDSEFVVESWKQRRFFSNEALFSLVKGAFRAVSGSMTERRHRFEVKTPVATIGVRGTEFWGGMTFAPNTLDVIMLNGKGVYIENEAGKTELKKVGTGTTVWSGKAPTSPAPWAEEKMKKAVSTITP